VADFSSLDDAAVRALYLLQHQPNEHMGALYHTGQGPQASSTVTSQRDGTVKGNISIPPGSLRGLFHNHPATGAEAATFSPDDKAQARQKKVPSYITTPDGRVFVFNPTAKGHGGEVLAEIPIQEIKMMIAQRIGQSTLSADMKKRLLTNLLLPPRTS
jgi:hypothetical protein